jgi:hypothetical protein
MMLPQLGPQEVQRLRALKWEFPTDPSAVLFEFHAREDGTIVMPVASMLFLKDLATAEAWLTVNGYSAQTLFDYVTVIRMDRLGQWPTRERLPLASLGVPPDANDDPRVRERRNETLSKTVFFIVGHELGHLVHGLSAQAACARPGGGPRPAGCSLAALQRSETAADEFAVELFRRMGLVPNASAFFFAIASRLHRLSFEFASELDWQAYARESTHPLDSARIAHVADRLAANRAAYVSAANVPGAAQRIDNLINDLRELARLTSDRDLGGLQVSWGKTLEPQDLKPRRSLTPGLRPQATDLTASGDFSGYFRGELRSEPAGTAQPLELLLRRRAGPAIAGELMLMGIRGRLDGRLDGAGRARMTVDIAGDIYDVSLEMSGENRVVTGSYQSRADRSAGGRLYLTRETGP